MAGDMPEANRITVHLMAVVAQTELEMISAKTTATLASAKWRGRKLGGYRYWGLHPERSALRAKTRAEQLKPLHRAMKGRPREPWQHCGGAGDGSKRTRQQDKRVLDRSGAQ